MSAHLRDGSGAEIGPLPIRVYIDGREDPILSIQEGGLEGGLRLVFMASDIEGVSNIQGGRVGAPNLDISAGGDGSADNPRGALVLQRDNGYGTFIGRGRATRSWAMEVRSYDDRTKDHVGFLNVPVRVKHLLVPDGHGGWRKASV